MVSGSLIPAVIRLIACAAERARAGAVRHRELLPAADVHRDGRGRVLGRLLDGQGRRVGRGVEGCGCLGFHG
mgnify:CR=1 FL=1